MPIKDWIIGFLVIHFYFIFWAYRTFYNTNKLLLFKCICQQSMVMCDCSSTSSGRQQVPRGSEISINNSKLLRNLKQDEINEKN